LVGIHVLYKLNRIICANLTLAKFVGGNTPTVLSKYGTIYLEKFLVNAKYRYSVGRQT